MFIIFLRKTDKADQAAAQLEGHREWIAQGRNEGAFLLVGSLGENLGGAILAAGGDRAEIEERIARDPFVAQGIVVAEVHAFTPAIAVDRLAFLLEQETA